MTSGQKAKRSFSKLQVHHYFKFCCFFNKLHIFLDHNSPESIKITPQCLAYQEVMVEWSFPGKNTDLLSYIVKAETDGHQAVESIVHNVQERKVILKPLHLSLMYTITVTAVYRDGIERKSSTEFFRKYGGFTQQPYTLWK